jgi:predicted transposase/invertase (TIGR01784 family)
MQSEAMKGDSVAAGHVNIRDRAVYYLCDLHAAQPGRSVRYGNLMRSYQITFCGYKVFPETERFINDFFLRSDTGLTLSTAVSAWFVELSKLGAAMKKPVAEMSPAEMWGIFFRHAHQAKYKKLLDNISSVKGEIKMAGELLANISQDEIERAHYRSRKMFRMDMEHDRLVSFDEGKAEGVAEGIVIGKTEGVAEGIVIGKTEGIVIGKTEGMAEGIVKGVTKGRTDEKADVVKNALAMGLPTEQIERLTGLSREEIERLRA